MANIRVKRGTRAQIDAAAAASGLAAGEPYLITDDAVPAIGLGDGTYAQLAVLTGALRIEVVTSLPGTPDPNTVYIVKPA